MRLTTAFNRILRLSGGNSAVGGVSAAISGLKVVAPIAAVLALGGVPRHELDDGVQQVRLRLLEPQDAAAVSVAFSELSVATYADRFDGYSGETFKMQGERKLENGDMLEGEIPARTIPLDESDDELARRRAAWV